MILDGIILPIIKSWMKNLVRLSKQYFSKGDDTIYALSTGTNTAISVQYARNTDYSNQW